MSDRHWSVERWNADAQLVTDEVTAADCHIRYGGTLVFYDEDGGILLAYSAHHWTTVSAH